MSAPAATDPAKSPIKEITQPIIDLIHAPRALWGINLGYVLEGMVYFGMLTYLAMYFKEYVGLDDVWGHRQVGVLTAGITISMFLFGGLADKWGVRRAILSAFVLLIGGRVLLALAPSLGLGSGITSMTNAMALGGILLIVIGYGMYQPAAYAGVKQFTSEKTAAMGYAMLYALMNLGGWVPTFFSPIRKAFGISGAYWVFVGATVLALLATLVVLSPSTVARALASAKAEREAEKESEGGDSTDHATAREAPAAAREGLSLLGRIGYWLKNHPLADAKFAYFIFCLIPVQTLFAYNWLVLPQYVERAFRGTWVGDNFEVAVNFNPILIFVLVPLITAATRKAKVYTMMILGTLVMSAPTFLLALGAHVWTLASYIVIMTIGEAMWQPRFLQYAAEIAPEGRTGAYMGVAQFPWFMTKMIVPLYSGVLLSRYCPETGPQQSETMWLIFAFIAMMSTVLLILAKGWLGKDFKTKA